MPLRKIADIPPPCMNREHEPPMHISLSPGVYEHTCPGCGKSVTFTVPSITCLASRPQSFLDAPRSETAPPGWGRPITAVV